MESLLRSCRLDISPILTVDLIHLRKIIHTGQKDIDFNHFAQVGSRSSQNGSKVLDTLVLKETQDNQLINVFLIYTEAFITSSVGKTYRVSLDVTINQFVGLRIHRYGT